MAQLDLFIYVGDEQVTGGDTTFPRTDYPNLVLLGRAMGHATRMEEFGRAEPSDATGIAGGTYDPYWDGTTFAFTSTGTPTATTIDRSGQTWGTNEFAGRLVTITSGAQNGLQRRISSNTATQLTFATLPGAPEVGATFRIEGGFVKFYHAPTVSLAGTVAMPFLADQTKALGDNWFGLPQVTPMAMLMRKLVAQYGYTGTGFRVIKDAIPGTTSSWIKGSGSGDHLDAQIAAAIDVEAAAGNTLKLKGFVLDAVTTDLFGINLYYESDLQRTIDSIRDRANVRSIFDAPTTAVATASTTTSLTVSTATWTTNQWKGRTVRIDAGAMSGQLRLVESNTATVITFHNNTPVGNYGPLASAPGNVAFSILASPLILIASPKMGVATSIATTLAPAARVANANTVARNTGVRIFDWGTFAELATAAETVQPFNSVASDRYYDVPSYITAGIALHNAISSYYAVLPSTAPGAAIPCVVLIGTSQMVTSTMTAQAIAMSAQYSLLGADPSTTTPYVWIWNKTAGVVQPMDVVTNCATFGTVLANNAGPEVTLARALVRDEFTNGVVVFKFARSGIALTAEAGSPNVAGYFEPGGYWEEFAVEFAKFKVSVMQVLGRSVDVIALVNDLSENDLTQLTAFKAKVPTHIDRVRTLCQTRVNDDVIPVFWMQPPPPAVDVTGGSTLGDPTQRRDVRTWIKDTLPTLRDDIYVLQNDGPRRYELQRTDNVHYAVEATLNIGEDFAELILEAFEDDDEGETTEGPSETAAFVVEDGSGLTSANSLVTVAFVRQYHTEQGDPSEIKNATDKQVRDWARQATTYLGNVYGRRWRGVIAKTTQALDWPRYDVEDADTGVAYLSTSLPAKLQRACAKVVLRLARGTVLQPDLSPGDGAVSASSFTVGPISFNDSFQGSRSTQPSFPEIERELRGLLRNAIGSSMLRIAR
ncbi:MAG: DnaT-like ssDNA-binding protein [Planctomycetota bacterium]